MENKKSCKDCFFYYESEIKVHISVDEVKAEGTPKYGFFPGGVDLEVGAPICSEFSKTWEIGE